MMSYKTVYIQSDNNIRQSFTAWQYPFYYVAIGQSYKIYRPVFNNQQKDETLFWRACKLLAKINFWYICSN